MKRTSLYFALLLLLVIVIALLGILILQRGPGENPDPSENPTAAPAAPTPAGNTQAPPAPTPAQSAAPAQTPQPTEPPVFETRPPLETEEPQESEVPETTPVPESNGSFRSDTGTGLNLIVNWRVYPDSDDGSAQLHVEVSAESYSFFTSALYQSIVLSANGEEYKADSPEIAYDGNEKLITPMAGFDLPAPASGSGIAVVWHYRGSYSGQQLGSISAASPLVY